MRFIASDTAAICAHHLKPVETIGEHSRQYKDGAKTQKGKGCGGHGPGCIGAGLTAAGLLDWGPSSAASTSGGTKGLVAGTRSCARLCAKKHTRRRQPMPSLHSCVRYLPGARCGCCCFSHSCNPSNTRPNSWPTSPQLHCEHAG